MSKNKIYLIILMLIVSFSVSARRGSDISINSSYLIPVGNSDFHSSLVLGLGTGFWGIFEFTGNAYLEIDNSKEAFFNKFQSPNVFSAGVGMNIPMGGFHLKGDYQRFFALESDKNVLSVSSFTDSYKFGIGIDLDYDVELEVYHRTLIDSRLDLIHGEKQSFIGIGLNITL